MDLFLILKVSEFLSFTLLYLIPASSDKLGKKHFLESCKSLQLGLNWTLFSKFRNSGGGGESDNKT